MSSVVSMLLITGALFVASIMVDSVILAIFAGSVFIVVTISDCTDRIIKSIKDVNSKQ